jgi:hypothetical protein
MGSSASQHAADRTHDTTPDGICAPNAKLVCMDSPITEATGVANCASRCLRGGCANVCGKSGPLLRRALRLDDKAQSDKS